MLVPAAVGTTLFYPMGNTPAESLTRMLPQGVDGRILSLGCGDVRKILYTMYMEKDFPSRQLDFTCCDYIPDIHVRNLVFFSFLVDGHFDVDDTRQLDRLWDLYYHFYLSEEATLQLLQDQVGRLLVQMTIGPKDEQDGSTTTSASASAFDKWHAGPYGRYLRFCDAATFRDVHSGLAQYSAALESIKAGRDEGGEANDEERKQAYREYQQAFLASLSRAANRKRKTGIRSLAPYFGGRKPPVMESLQPTYQYFWEHGATPGGTAAENTGAKDEATETVANPLFACLSSKSIKLHYGLDPLLGYHLAPAMVALVKTSPLLVEKESERNEKDDQQALLARLGQAARVEFRAMVRAFSQAISCDSKSSRINETNRNKKSKKNKKNKKATPEMKEESKTRPMVIIRFVTADAVALCHKLQKYRTTPAAETGSFDRLWNRRQVDSQPLQLGSGDDDEDRRQPMAFDVIDTSNLADHVGALNLLTAAAPLLATDRAWAVLLMEHLLEKNNGNEASVFEDLLGGHTPTVALLLGVTPVEYYTNARTEYEFGGVFALMKALSDDNEAPRKNQKRFQVTWKRSSHFSAQTGTVVGPSLRKEKLIMGAEDLASAFQAVYASMFAHEKYLSLSGLFSMLGVSVFQKNLLAHSYPYFHRGSFAAFLRAVRRRLWAVDEATWNDACLQFLRWLSSEGNKQSSSYDEELRLQLSIWGAYSGGTPASPRPSPPHLAALTIVVPRDSLERLYGQSKVSRVSSPILVVSMTSVRQEPRRFAVVQCMFGRASQTSGGPVTVSTQGGGGGEDESEMPLVVRTCIPLERVDRADGTAETVLSVGLHEDMYNLYAFARGSDKAHAIHTTAFGRDDVFVEPWTHEGEDKAEEEKGGQEKQEKQEKEEEGDSTITVSVDRRSGKMTALAGRVSILSPKGQRLLADRRVQIRVVPSPTSAFVVDVVFGGKGSENKDEEPLLVCPVCFPLPVAQANDKGSESGVRLRIARTSGWVEAVVAMPPLTAEAMAASRFENMLWPTILASSGDETCLPVTLAAVPHVNLDALPALDPAEENRADFAGWLTVLMVHTLSGHEKRMREPLSSQPTPPPKTARLNFKDSVNSMIQHVCGMKGRDAQTGLFTLNLVDSSVNRRGGQALIFVSALRIDGAVGSLVIDAAVLPLTMELLQQNGGLIDFLRLCHHQRQMCTIPVDEAELVLWKLALPAMAERCRTWSHQAGCAYQKPGATIPLNVAPGEPVLCACGQGQLPPDFVALPLWKETVAPHATRVAISLVFPDLYVDTSGRGLRPRLAGCRSCGAMAAQGGRGGPLKRCMRCQGAQYCSVACQKKDWPAHRLACRDK